MAKQRASDDRSKGTRARSANIPLAVAGAAILRQQYEKIRAAETGVRLGDDIEALHQMRVETARLRAALRLFVPDEARETFAPITDGARNLARALGNARNLDVLHDDLRDRAEQITADVPAIGALLDALDRVRQQRQEELLAVLDETATQHLWEALPPAIVALEQAADHRVTVRNAAPRLLRRRLRVVTRLSDRLNAPTAVNLHYVRIRCKRLRYAGEFFKPWLKRRLDRLIEAATALQDTLGTLHDGDVASDILPPIVDVALARAESEPAIGYELARATLALVRDRLRERDELLVRLSDQWAELRAVGRDTKFNAIR